MSTKKFNNVEEFLDHLPEDELKITQYLIQLVENTLINYTIKLNYNVPFYAIHKNICFIWPASVLWGKKKTYSGVRFGFTKGYLLNDDFNYLDKGDRKQVYWKDFKHINEIDIDLLKTLLFEAIEIDKTK